MTQSAELGQIANISTGYSFRTAIKAVPNGNIRVLQAKDISNILNIKNITTISSTIISPTAFISEKDILLVARGVGIGNFKSAVYKSTDKSTVAASSLYILRLNDDKITSDFLSLYLNSPTGQSEINKLLLGSNIKNLSKQNLEKLKIPIPPIKNQISIVNLQTNITKQKDLTERKNKIKDNIINSIFKNLIQ